MLPKSGLFDFYSPTKVKFEAGSAKKLGNLISGFGTRFLIVNIRKDDQNPSGLVGLYDSLSSVSGGCVIYDELIGDPDTEQVDSATYFSARSHADCIVAYGGIDSINTAKAISLLVTNSIFSADLLTKPVESLNPPLPLVVIPTEPTLGEELSSYFTLVDAEDSTRKSFSTELTFPKACFYDTTLSNYITKNEAGKIGGALLSYSIERFFSPGSNVAVDTLLLQILRLMNGSILEYYNDPGHEKATRNIYWSSMMTGLTLMSSPNGLNWVLAQVLSARTQLDYHQALALMLPYVMEFYLTTCSEKYVQISHAFNLDRSGLSIIESAIQLIEFIRNLFSDLNLPSRLSEFYITKQQVHELATSAAKYPQLANSPRKLGADEIESILLTAI